MTVGANSVFNGPNRLVEQDFSGMTVGDVRAEYGEYLNLAPNATATINNVLVDDSQRIVNGETIVFSKPLGEKGSF